MAKTHFLGLIEALHVSTFACHDKLLLMLLVSPVALRNLMKTAISIHVLIVAVWHHKLVHEHVVRWRVVLLSAGLRHRRRIPSLILAVVLSVIHHLQPSVGVANLFHFQVLV